MYVVGGLVCVNVCMLYVCMYACMLHSRIVFKCNHPMQIMQTIRPCMYPDPPETRGDQTN
jgi:hypothetical protein